MKLAWAILWTVGMIVLSYSFIVDWAAAKPAGLAVTLMGMFGALRVVIDEWRDYFR